jgi:hypothetical protein
MGRPDPLATEDPCFDAFWFLPVGYVMSIVYGSTGQVDNVEELRHWITAAVVSATPEMFSHIWSEIEFWLDICCVTKGAHVEIY